MRTIKKVFITFAACIMALGISAVGVSAAEGEEITSSRGQIIGRYDAEGQIVFRPDNNPHNNVIALNELCGNSKKRPLLFPGERP